MQDWQFEHIQGYCNHRQRYQQQHYQHEGIVWLAVRSAIRDTLTQYKHSLSHLYNRFIRMPELPLMEFYLSLRDVCHNHRLIGMQYRGSRRRVADVLWFATTTSTSTHSR
jgi:hypothetical protein